MMDRRFLNRPVRLHWAGWETDTLSLGRVGWQISAEQDMHRNRMRIAINHPKAQVQGITEMETFLFRDMMDGRCDPTLPVMLRFNTMAREIYINTMTADVEFSPIDYRPQMVETRIQSLSDLANFTTLVEEPRNEIYLREANMEQILEMALQRQEPDQDRIRKEMLREQELRNLRMGTLHTELRLVA